MGSDVHYPEEGPQHFTEVDPILVDPYPVTNRQFRRFVEETGWVSIAERRIDGEEYPDLAVGTDDEPGSLVFVPTPGPVPPTLTFASVPGVKRIKNRLHLDLNPTDRSQAEEVRRLLGLGARHVDVGQGDQSWVVLADPEGNEFCVLATRCP